MEGGKARMRELEKVRGDKERGGCGRERGRGRGRGRRREGETQQGGVRKRTTRMRGGETERCVCVGANGINSVFAFFFFFVVFQDTAEKANLHGLSFLSFRW